VSQDTPEHKAYVSAWEAKHPGEKLPIFGEYNYDMVKLTAKAMRMSESMDSTDIAEALHKASQGFMGATGDKTFDENGDVGANYGRWTVKDGEIVDYKK
jgi:ABC-type branched-subunit amino acid transport system substrate-binding protein